MDGDLEEASGDRESIAGVTTNAYQGKRHPREKVQEDRSREWISQSKG